MYFECGVSAKLRNRLEYLEKFPLLQNAYEQSKQLYNQNKSSWYGSLQRILQNFPTISQLKGM
jgi:hypothetical protein